MFIKAEVIFIKVSSVRTNKRQSSMFCFIAFKYSGIPVKSMQWSVSLRTAFYTCGKKGYLLIIFSLKGDTTIVNIIFFILSTSGIAKFTMHI